MMPKKRRKMFVDRQVQGALVRRLLMHWLLTCLTIVIYVLITELFVGGIEKSLSHHVAAAWAKYGILMIILITVFPVFAYDSVKVSNKFAGPMHSFRQALSQLANGEQPRPLRFREGDFWQEIATDLNRIADRIHQSKTQQPEVSEV